MRRVCSAFPDALQCEMLFKAQGLFGSLALASSRVLLKIQSRPGSRLLDQKKKKNLHFHKFPKGNAYAQESVKLHCCQDF